MRNDRLFGQIRSWNQDLACEVKWGRFVLDRKIPFMKNAQVEMELLLPIVARWDDCYSDIEGEGHGKHDEIENNAKMRKTFRMMKVKVMPKYGGFEEGGTRNSSHSREPGNNGKRWFGAKTLFKVNYHLQEGLVMETRSIERSPEWT